MNLNVMDRFRGTPTGQKVLEEMEDQDLQRRKDLLAQVQKLEASREPELKPLKDKLERARVTEEKARQALEAAQAQCRQAYGEHYARSHSLDSRIGKLKRQLADTAPSAIQAFMDDVHELHEKSRARGPGGCTAGYLEQLRDIRRQAEELKFGPCDNIDVDLNRLRQRVRTVSQA